MIQLDIATNRRNDPEILGYKSYLRNLGLFSLLRITAVLFTLSVRIYHNMFGGEVLELITPPTPSFSIMQSTLAPSASLKTGDMP
jgi:hypothetical protein